MGLPVELRLRIYEIAFETGNYQELAPRRPSNISEPALLRTSRQIRNEAIRVSIGQVAFDSNFQSYMQNANPPTSSRATIVFG
jgi:hypothetical protein